MDLRRLRYLVAIADCGSFTRAAEMLHTEQPPLSQQIKALERELGLILFTRSRQGAVPTEAGALLIEQARVMLEMERQMASLARGLARGEQGRLRIGLAGAVSMLPLVPRAIRAFRERWPEIVITMEESNTPALCEALRERRIDIAVVRPPAPDPDIVVRHLLDEPTVIALPSDHPRASGKGLRLSAVADEPFIIFERVLGPGFYDAIIAACQRAGFVPRFGQSAPQIAATVSLVAAGLGISVVPSCLDQIHAGGVTYHAIIGPAPRATLAIAARDEAPSLPAQHFEALLREAAGRIGAGDPAAL
ncbi:LysR substrate-binding domain-containing protein [Tanticharoenia sakaeratensis]|uniref:LysR family transcriptional regulator n=1 Tax=Tanticharoenia sakaeratensis NBRC 103193 TaxID=1231623 RepID=A0A0D6MK10_9PROT|nr:LysR substrate-binding domain-containing protein [Tanticharoenia sakaeratensis]GAN54009.1 LysR family transcriptional regulator [Tanticharoenia sakaeratensis NBRC 103193]GBQ23104.1 LysR family transcriptional regulator [Tanticharoenia sakaeratensis NBRC 103193]